MSPENPEHLLSSYALGGLSDEERERLFQAALVDQELFDRLVEEEKVRLGLLQAENRALLLDALREDRVPTWIRRVAAWFRQPKYLALSAATAVALTIAILVWTGPSGGRLDVLSIRLARPPCRCLAWRVPSLALHRRPILCNFSSCQSNSEWQRAWASTSPAIGPNIALGNRSGLAYR